MFIILNGNSGVPLYQQIVAQMRAKILGGELQAGEPLPSIRQLAVDLMTSVITTKRAYQELELMGLIQTRPGLGTFVAGLQPSSIREITTDEILSQLANLLQNAKRLGMPTATLRQLFEQVLRMEDEKNGK